VTDPAAPTPSNPLGTSPSTGTTTSSGSIRLTESRVVVRPMPKVIFFYLTWLASLVFGIIESIQGSASGQLGTWWILLFAFNLLVISFDFNETKSIAAVFIVVSVIFAGLYFGFLPFLGDILKKLNVQMNVNFYFSMFGLFSIFYLVIFLRSRFEYWEFRNNEVLHRTGMFGEIKRYSTEDLRWFKEIPDVLERILLRSGRMVITTSREPHPIVIENVIGIESVDEKIAELLGAKRVTLK
jgi:hypothetical protein